MKYNLRCKTCNRVSSQEIESNIGDYLNKNFVQDPVDSNSFICEECKEWHEDLMLDYEVIYDDPYGWEEDGTMDLIQLELETLELQPCNDNSNDQSKRRTDSETN
jgi:hypothetical protein